jgi:hypothetical protein
VLSTRRIHRPAILTAFACALLVSAISGPAAARPQQDLRSPDARDAGRTSSLAGTTSTPRQNLRSPDARDVEIALAQERYYSSYGEPEPLTLPQSPIPSDDTPWLPIALSIASALVIVAASAIQLRRLRLRRRHAVRSMS